MVFLKRALDVLLFGNLFIGLGALSLTISTSLTEGFLFSSLLPLLVLVFFATVFIYSFHAWYTLKVSYENTSFRVRWIISNKKLLQFFSGVALLICSVCAFFLNIQTLLLLVPCFLLSLFYTIRVTLNGKRISLKELPFLKVLLVAFVWATVTVGMPFLEIDEELRLRFVNLWFERFFFIAALCIPFDIRDESEDRKSDIVTLPVFSGSYVTKILSLCLFCVYLLFAFANLNFNKAVVIIFPCCFFILGAGQIKNDYFYNISGDGVLVLYGLVFLIFDILTS